MKNIADSNSLRYHDELINKNFLWEQKNEEISLFKKKKKEIQLY